MEKSHGLGDDEAVYVMVPIPVRNAAVELATHILHPKTDSKPEHLAALARQIHNELCRECDVCESCGCNLTEEEPHTSDCLNCPDCGRNMAKGEPHTSECLSALRQDAEDGDAEARSTLVAMGKIDANGHVSWVSGGETHEMETEGGCGERSPNDYICTHHSSKEHLCRGAVPGSIADSWPLDQPKA